MYDQLPILLQLQEIDGEIDKLESKKAEIPVELRAMEAELEKYTTAMQAQEKVLEEIQKERRSKDRQLSFQQAQLEKYKQQRLAVKTNKEYAALESEIADLEEANSEIEDEILELMISIDEANGKLGVIKQELKEQEDKFNKRKDELLSRLKELDLQIAVWNKRRRSFLGKINPGLMSKYDSWRKRRGSSLVAVIEGQSCGGCHLTLPPQLINDVRKKRELHICNSCGRILYWKDEEPKNN